jgi:hypothetical protein
MDRKTIAVALLLASGCSLTTKTDDLEPLKDAEGFCTAYWSKVLDYLQTCQGLDPSYGEVIYAGQLAQCPSWARSQDAGRLRYDRTLAKACIDAINGGGCDLDEGDLASCERAIRPNVGPGGACGWYNECDFETTSGCRFTGNTCPGTCAPQAGLNQSCASVNCQTGLICDYNGSGNCVAPPAAGQACISFACAQGLYCDGSNVCRPWGRLGAACPLGWECDSGFYCDATRTPQSCQPFPEVRAQTAVGARCDYPYYCSSGLWCDYSTPVPSCRAQQLNGDCTATSDACRPSQVCVPQGGGATRTCQNPKGLGQSCTGGNYECQQGLTCNGAPAGTVGTCVPPGVIGDVCVFAEERYCRTGWCDYTGTFKCADYLALGSACSYGGQCSLGGVAAECRYDGMASTCVASCR